MSDVLKLIFLVTACLIAEPSESQVVAHGRLQVAIDKNGIAQATLIPPGAPPGTSITASLDEQGKCPTFADPPEIQVAPQTPYIDFLKIANRLQDCHAKSISIAVNDNDAPILLDTWWAAAAGDFLTFIQALGPPGVSTPEIKAKAAKLKAPVFVSVGNENIFLAKLNTNSIKPISKGMLAREVKTIQELPGSSRDIVLIRSDFHVPFSRFFEIAEILNQSGQYHLALSTESTEDTSSR